MKLAMQRFANSSDPLTSKEIVLVFEEPCAVFETSHIILHDPSIAVLY